MKPPVGKSGTSEGGEGQGAGQGEGQGTLPNVDGTKPGAAGQQGSDEPTDDNSDDSDDSAWDEKTKAYIAKLRGENAKHRTKAKELGSQLSQSEEQKKAILKAAGIEIEEGDPAVLLQETQAATHALAFRNAILESAVANGVGADSLEFYQFLVEKRAGELGEDEELSEEHMAEIVQKVNARGANGGTTSVGVGQKSGQGNPGGPPKPGSSGELTLDKFCKMNMSEKSELYGKNPALYGQLSQEARRTNRLI